MSHVFGRSIDFRFLPIVDDEDASAYSLVSARIYSAEPTSAQRQNTASGHVEEVTSWTVIATGEYSITFAPLTDPSPTSTQGYETYFVAVNFRYQSGGPIEDVVEQIFVFRPDALTSKVSVTPTDVYGLESKIQVLKNDAWVQPKIDVALREVDNKLAAKGVKRSRTFNRDKLKDAVLFRATARCCFDLGSDGANVWMEKGRMWMESSTAALDAVVLGYDVDGDDRPTPEEKSSSGGIYVMR